ncbi:ATP-dependent helicase [Syntrophus aciditrophicus]|uniref:DNA 3'-5' helicase n=1 Tax=Syntrophus aciditrophicus (strain SB) TaxID=56780 RepID=Q2LTE2_SYNAS|nr:ATP-dependent helicase [Syntrophus aciditrophicus]ABC77352.1 uvrD/rep helicase [Syntrophus aciditrophicus SB]OPY17491.1 MAG: ATP-dependent DNA helicase PcrA [Syntrophus sp. PtaB.Bin075]
MIDYEKELNEEQCHVVLEAGGPMLVLAGAGSGKTRTLTYRVARLVETGIKPERILLATFTNKAARSMLNRVRELVPVDLSRLSGGTFHHNGHFMLRAHAERLGYTRSFSILDTEDARQLISTCVVEAGIDTKGATFPKANVLYGILSLAVNTAADLSTTVAERYPFFSHRLEDIRKVAALYDLRKRQSDFMDFDDLLLNWRRLLLECPDVLQHYAERFEHILVDEYQDTNRIQAEIMDLLASRHRNIMVVGDDSQSIYAFRGANFANIMSFPEKYPDCRIFKLETNYRSTPEILHLANLSIENNENQFAKSLRAVREAGLRPVVVPARNALQQAEFVAQRILELHRDGIPLHEMAILYRAHFHAMDVQMELTRRGIPYEIRSGIRFFEQAHIKDVTAYLRILGNPLDELAWKRIFGLCPKIGKKTAEKLWQFLSESGEPLEAALREDFLKVVSKTARGGLAFFQEVLIKLREEAVHASTLPDLISLIIERGYRKYLRETYTDTASREEDLEQLAEFSGKFSSLEDFLSELSLMTNMDADGRDKAAGDDLQENKVILSTVHQAKGLEWSVVLLVGCAEGMIPLERAVQEAGGEEEERRLFYVAATRAKDYLYLCYPQTDYSRWAGFANLSPSRFIRELVPSSRKKELPFEHWVVEEQW